MWAASGPRATANSLAQVGAPLRVYLLGSPHAGYGGQSLNIPRRQARALLYCLAAHPRPVSREQLCFLFWPDRPEASARRCLSHLLTHLRRALPGAGLQVMAGDQVGLDPQCVWSDSAAFERLCAIPYADCSTEALREAVELYRGPFLDGFSLPDCPEFEMWAVGERARCQGLYLNALAALIEERTGRGDYAAAIHYAQRYLAADDLAEDIHRRLIELYAAVGNPGAALRQFECCVATLERELGVNPLPETQAAYRAVLEGRSLRPATPAVKPGWETLPSLDVPLSGREEALHRLGQLFSAAQKGHGAAVLISGEAGIGKSRLMQEFATRLGDRVQVLAGAGHADTQTMPYQPVVQALRPALLSEPARFRPLYPWLTEASRLMPELHTVHPGLPPPLRVRPKEARARLFEALCQLVLEMASGPRPLLLCLDDLHWADGETLGWLGFVGRRISGSRIVVVGTYRSEEAYATAALSRGLNRLGILVEVTLTGLDEASVLRIVQQQARTRGSVREETAVARRLREITGGNPFFLLETLRVLIESGWEPAALGSPQAIPLPDTVRGAVRARIEHLTPKARQVLEAGAVLGHDLDFDTVHLTAGRQEMEAMDGLDELVSRQLLLEQPSAYQFRHEIVREAVYQGMSTWRRRLLHRRAGEALERLRRQDAAALAWHFEQAGEMGRAAQHALQAGLSAKAVFAHREARGHFDRALALLQREVAHLRDPAALVANQQLRVRILAERGWVFRLLGDMQAYASDLEEEARLAAVIGAQETLAHLRWREAACHRWFCHYDEALAAGEAGLGLSQAAGDPLLEANCWREVGLAARATGDYVRAETALQRALSLFEDLDEPVYEIHVLGNLSTLHWCLGNYEQAMAWARREMARCDQVGLPLERRLPLGDMGAAAAALGDGAQARQCLYESRDIARQIADCTQEIFCLGHLGWLAGWEKRPAEGVEHLQAALSLAGQIGSCAEQGWLLAGLAEAHLLAGDLEQARTCARRAQEMARLTGQAYDRVLVDRILSRLGPDSL